MGGAMAADAGWLEGWGCGPPVDGAGVDGFW